ncbi:MAG: sulfatase-like hydrolase/transferase [Myxococcales bacterium]|nr:sulfatase-like hydrolase/transferase [Myxococcales bacterium]
MSKNILMIMVDEARMPMHMPAGLELPAVSWLQQRGLSFLRHHANTAPCTPSRSVVFTGQHTARNGMFDNTSMPYIDPMKPAIPTLGDMLGSAGYYCAYKGKWHLANITPVDEPRHTTEHDMEPYGFHDYQATGDVGLMIHEGFIHDGLFVEEALHWLRMRDSQPTDAQRDKPFFLVVSLVNPHDIMTADVGQARPEKPEPVLAPVPNDAIYAKTWSTPMPSSWHHDYCGVDQGGKPPAHAELERIFDYQFGSFSKDLALWQRYLDYYVNAMRDADAQIMRLLQFLERSGRLEDTIIVFTADHGEMAGAHGLRMKGPNIYKENLNVPLIVCHPDGPAGATTSALSCHLDLAPTLLGLAGVSQASWRGQFPGLLGYDLSGLLATPGAVGPRREVLVTYTSPSTVDADLATGKSSTLDPSKRGLLAGIITDSMKFARYFSPTDVMIPTSVAELRAHFDVELYDLKADGDERTNLAVDGAHDGDLLELNEKLNALLQAEMGIPDIVLPDIADLKDVQVW